MRPQPASTTAALDEQFGRYAPPTTGGVYRADELLGSHAALRWLTSRIGFDTSSHRRFLALMVLVPSVLFSVVTIGEGRFWLRSVHGVVSGTHYDAIGMSFLGDTMVWPFFVLVPAALLLLKYAAR